MRLLPQGSTSITARLQKDYCSKVSGSKGVILWCCCLIVFVCAGMVGVGEDSRYVRRADKAFALEDFALAAQLYARAIAVNPANAQANYKLGYCYLELHQPKMAKVYLKKAQELNPASTDGLLLLYLAEAHHQDYDFEQARSYYQQEMRNTPRTDWVYIQFLQKRMDECAAGAMLVMKPSVAQVVNLGAGINTASAEYGPVLMPGDQTMLYTFRKARKAKNGLPLKEEHIRASALQSGEWQKSKPLQGLPQEQGAVVGTAAQGQELYTFFAGRGLHRSNWQEEAWSLPLRLEKPFNEGDLEPSLFVTGDGRFAFFSSNRDGGYGGLDLYVCARQADGSWGKALNLGPAVNTAFDEDAPFVDSETNTLYFSSLGHNTMGGYDIFRSSLVRGEWSPAQNLGYPINSPHDDVYFTLSHDRGTAYFSSDRPGGFGAKDLYRVILLSQVSAEK